MRLVSTAGGGLALELSPRELAIEAATRDLSATPLRLTDGRVLLVAFLRRRGVAVGYYDAQTGRSVAGLYSVAQLAEFLAAACGAAPVELSDGPGLVACRRCGALHVDPSAAASTATGTPGAYECAPACEA